MSNIEVFENKEFGKVRTIVLNDEPWFVGKDVADILGYQNGSRDINRHVDEDDRQNYQNGTFESPRGMTVINESGVYSLVFGSKLPTAKKFKHWVTSEVLPAIRKNGGYIAGQETLSDDELMAKALLVAQRTIENKNKLIADMKPKADFYDTVVSTESLLSMGDTAKLINKKGIGRNNLYKILKARKILMADNIPYQQYIERGYFKVVESYYMAGDNKVIAKTTYVKQKGVDYIRKLVDEM